MEQQVMEALIGAGMVAGGALYGFWASRRNSRKELEPVKAGQSEVLEAINLTRKDVQGLGERVDERMDATDRKNDGRFRDLGQRVGKVETDVAEIRGEVRAIKQLHVERGCVAAVPRVTEGEPAPGSSGAARGEAGPPTATRANLSTTGGKR